MVNLPESEAGLKANIEYYELLRFEARQTLMRIEQSITAYQRKLKELEDANQKKESVQWTEP